MRNPIARLIVATQALGFYLADRSPFLWWVVFALLLGATIGWAMLFVYVLRMAVAA